MTNFMKRFLKDESGATAIEYGLIAALISVTIIAAVASIGGRVKTKFETVNDALAPAAAAPAA